MVALCVVLLAAGCGGGGGSEEPTETPAPTQTQGTSDVAGARTQAPQSPTPSTPETYEVVGGDTLWDIAERFGTTVEALVELNQLASADDLQVGQSLKITGTPAAGTPGAATTTAATQ